MQNHRTPLSLLAEFGPALAIYGPAVSQLEHVCQLDAATLARSEIGRLTISSRVGSVAVINVRGILTKSLDFNGTFITLVSYETIRNELRSAAEDPSVTSIVLRIDSPGGSASGAHDTAAEVRRIAAIKPIVALADDLAASGAYWIASGATKLYAGASALVGSIGTYATLVDASAMAESAGIKVHVVRAGEFKGTGVPGTPITAEQLADIQRVVDSLNALFVGSFAAGRKMALARAQALADGRVHVGAEAVKAGLVDGVATFDEVIGIAAGSSGIQTTARTAAAATPGVAAATPSPAAPRVRTQQELAEDFSALVDLHVRAHGITRRQAIRESAKARPDLYNAYVAQTTISALPPEDQAAHTEAQMQAAVSVCQQFANEVARVKRERGVSAVKAGAIVRREQPALAAKYDRLTKG